MPDIEPRLYSDGTRVERADGRLMAVTGITDASILRLRNQLGQWRKMDVDARFASVKLTTEIAERLKENVKREFAVHDKTGETTRSLSVRFRGLLATIIMRGGAEYVEYGTEPHTISSRNLMEGGVLKFWGEQTSEWVYRAEVFHPGTDADPFLERAIIRTNPEREFARLAYGVYREMIVRPPNSIT